MSPDKDSATQFWTIDVVLTYSQEVAVEAPAEWTGEQVLEAWENARHEISWLDHDDDAEIATQGAMPWNNEGDPAFPALLQTSDLDTDGGAK